jgi:hypothetical protein
MVEEFKNNQTGNVGESETLTPETKTEESQGNSPLGQKKESSVRTYANDIADLIRKGTTISGIALSEQKRKLENQNLSKEPEENRSSKDRSKLMIIVSVILVLISVIIITISYFFFEGGNESKPQELRFESLVFSNSEVEADLTDLDRVSTLKKLNQERIGFNGVLGSIANIYPTKSEGSIKSKISSGEFLSKVAGGASQVFIRSLEDDFMIGVHSFDGNQGFLIFEIESFQNTLSGSLDWEKSMLDNLWPMFWITKPNIESVSGGLNTFKDVVVSNKDARELKDASGKTALIYSFPDRRYLVITTNRSTLLEVFKRIAEKNKTGQ